MQEYSEYKQIQGEKVEEINSELTEIIKLQKMAAEAQSEFAGVQAYDVLIGKLATHIRSRAKYVKAYVGDLELLKDIEFEHRNDRLEHIKSEPRVKDWVSVVFLHIGNDLTTRQIVPAESYLDAMVMMKEQAYARLKEKRIEQYRKMMALISDEFDLHKDLTTDRMTQDDFDRAYFNE